jgi:hypothetical protein
MTSCYYYTRVLTYPEIMDVRELDIMTAQNQDAVVAGDQEGAQAVKPARQKRQPKPPSDADLAASNNLLARFAGQQPNPEQMAEEPKKPRSKPQPKKAGSAPAESRGRGRPKLEEETLPMSMRMPVTLVAWLGEKAKSRFDPRQRNISVQQIAIELLNEQMEAEKPAKKGGRKNG